MLLLEHPVHMYIMYINVHPFRVNYNWLNCGSFASVVHPESGAQMTSQRESTFNHDPLSLDALGTNLKHWESLETLVWSSHCCKRSHLWRPI